MSQELEKVMEALLQAHVFPDRLTLQHEAFRALLMLRPELRIEGAIALSQEEVRTLIQELWEKDKLVIVDPEEIFHV